MDPDAELEILGSMLTDPSVIVPVLDVVGSEHFSYSSNRVVFEAIRKLSGKGRDVDPISVKAELAGDQAALDRLLMAINSGAFPRHAVQHAERVRELAGLRSLAALGSDLRAAACEEGANLRPVLEDAERSIFAVATGGRNGQVSWADATDEALTRLEYRYQTDSPVTGLPIGIQSIDNRTTGLHEGWLVLVAGRPGDGKTALAMQSAVYVAEYNQGAPVLFVSLEMSAVELASRAICARAGISYTRIARSQLSDAEFAKFVNAQAELSELPLELYDAGKVTVSEIMSRVRHVKPILVVVDYVGLIRPERYHPRKDIELGEISAGLKAIAKECRIPVLACVQVNRNFSKRDDKALQLEDLRDSGSLEQDADVVYLLQRIEKDGPPMVAAKCAKHRHGPTGTDRLLWKPEITRFVDAF